MTLGIIIARLGLFSTKYSSTSQGKVCEFPDSPLMGLKSCNEASKDHKSAETLHREHAKTMKLQHLSLSKRNFNRNTKTPIYGKPEYHAHQPFNIDADPAYVHYEGVSSIHDPQMGKTLARKLESQYVFNI